MNIDFPDWIPKQSTSADENGVAYQEGWSLFACEADWEPCGFEGEDNGSQLKCLARPGHEHPHVACNMAAPMWDNPKMRVDCVTRKTGVIVHV
jgi:hypothetical protein